ncbi:class I SAM-dependent methyltransferase [Nocardioides marinquilinus]|uniref:Class I SAM-dependent methyltransferase n=1 Tax=Nocardioides marinquilinus TaxID=1210400 RepID=A0ABP9PWY3_9ACTN
MTSIPTPFDAVWPTVDAIPGWLTHEQAGVLHDAALAAGPGARVVEIGSHLGRSTVTLATALPEGAVLTAVDPFGPDWRYGLEDTEARCREHLASAGVAHRVDLRVATGREVLAGWHEPVAVVYVDGKHDYLSVVADLRWERHLVPLGRLLVHDAYSSLGVTLGLLRVLLTTSRLRYVGRTGSLAVLEHARPTLRDRARAVVPLPWFLRNLVVKVLLRLRLAALARRLGHDGPDDPF